MEESWVRIMIVGKRKDFAIDDYAGFEITDIDKFINVKEEKVDIKLFQHSRPYELKHGDVIYFSEFYFNNINAKKIKAGTYFSLDERNNFTISDKENAYFVVTKVCQIIMKRFWWQFWKKPVFKGCNVLYIKEN